MNFSNFLSTKPCREQLETFNRVLESLMYRLLVLKKNAVNETLSDVNSQYDHRILQGGSADHPDPFELTMWPTIPSDLLYRKMLPSANLNYGFRTLGRHGVSAAAPDYLVTRQKKSGFKNISGTPLTHSIEACPSTTVLRTYAQGDKSSASVMTMLACHPERSAA
jgi:hypothetical protein